MSIQGSVRSVETAIDYSNIDELAEEDTEKFVQIGLQSSSHASKGDEGKQVKCNLMSDRHAGFLKGRGCVVEMGHKDIHSKDIQRC